MNRIARLLLVAVLAGAVPAAAQNWLGRRVSLDLKGMAPAEAFKVLADAVGTKVTVDPSVTATVDILVRNVSARTALTTLCESIGCRWTADAAGIAVRPVADDVRVRVSKRAGAGDPKVVKRVAVGERLRAAIKQPLPDGFVCHNMPLAAFSEKVSEAVKMNVVIDTDDPAMQTVAGDFSRMTLQSVLKRLAEQEGDRRVTLRLAITEEGHVAIMVGKGPVKRKRQ
jgi:type II secretory pathway component GspD/PulD (secretin)